MTRNLLLLVALAACRSYPVPDVTQPTLGADIEIKSTTATVKIGTQDVCDGESRCRTEDKTREEQRSQILAGGKPVTYGELRLLDPGDGGAYAKALAEYKERSEPCRAGRKYKIAGIAATVAGGIVALIDGAPTAVRIGGLALAGAGIVVIVLGVNKSSGCDEVHKLYVDSGLSIAEKTTVADRKKELEEIAARFNAHRSR
jgi:hypothetical protein